jgi:uncharacterized protein DUF6854
MAVTVVTRWTTPDAEASTKVAKRAKEIWMKNGAQDFRLSQIYSGQYCGQWLVSTTFADMAAFGKATNAMPNNAEMKAVQADNSRIGAALQERWILVGTDL